MFAQSKSTWHAEPTRAVVTGVHFWPTQLSPAAHAPHRAGRAGRAALAAVGGGLRAQRDAQISRAASGAVARVADGAHLAAAVGAHPAGARIALRAIRAAQHA